MVIDNGARIDHHGNVDEIQEIMKLNKLHEISRGLCISNQGNKNKSDRVQTSDAFWRSVRVLVSVYFHVLNAVLFKFSLEIPFLRDSTLV